VKTVLGVSNISFGLDAYPRRVQNPVFLHEAVENGLDVAIVNYTKIYPLYKIPSEEVELARKLIYQDRSNGDPLQVYMQHFTGMKGKAQAQSTAHVETLSIEDKLKYAIINGEISGRGQNETQPGRIAGRSLGTLHAARPDQYRAARRDEDSRRLVRSAHDAVAVGAGFGGGDEGGGRIS
jgi:5-methyltetrahydrofolate--homocysteine methyltransferase